MHIYKYVASILIRRYLNMWWTILAFLVTLFIFVYFLRPNLGRNYRVSLWHYLMASTPTTQVVETPVPPSDTIMPSSDTIMPSSDTITPQPETPSCAQETGAATAEIVPQLSADTIEPQMSADTIEPPENGSSEGKKLEGETTNLENGGEIIDAQLPIDVNMASSQTASEMDTEIETKPGTETGAKTETETETVPNSSGGLEQSQENERQKADETGTKPETIPISGGEIEQATQKSDNDEGDWEIVEKKSKKRTKNPDEESPPKSAKGSNTSPMTYGLRRTKQRQQVEWENFVSGLSRELQKMMGGYHASEDTERYLAGYPEAEDIPALNLNLEFYLNKIKSEPNGELVEEIHEKWFGLYDWLEQHHGYIQWLFPIQEQGLNHRAHPLQKHEIERLISDGNMRNRLISSYELMLDFFGMKLVDKITGKIARSDKNQIQQYILLNTSYHNYLRITRILKCLGEFGLEDFQAPFCEFVLSEIFENNKLNNTLKSCLSYWGKVIRNIDERKSFYETADKFVRSDIARKGGIVKRELNQYFF